MEENKKIKALVMGFGNIGRYAVESLNTESDFELVGIVDPFITAPPRGMEDITFAKSLEEAPDFDVALLCVPTRKVKETGLKVMSMGKRCVDIFDIHGEEVLDLYLTFKEAALKYNTASLSAAGWDPGIDSVIRTLLSIMIPKGLTYTNYGPGMSMGHTVAVKAIKGVKDAVSLTYPKGSGLHRRLIYILPEPEADRAEIENAIKTDSYFIHDEVNINFVDSLEDARDFGHSCEIERKGRSGIHNNQRATFKADINNPAVTSQALVMSARAVMRQRPGAYTMNMVPPCDFLNISIEKMLLTLT